jgi:hypothetical protein
MNKLNIFLPWNVVIVSFSHNTKLSQIKLLSISPRKSKNNPQVQLNFYFMCLTAVILKNNSMWWEKDIHLNIILLHESYYHMVASKMA